jgi:UDP-glucose 4-epimerase
LIQDYARQLNFNPTILRFFNIVGKSPYGNSDVHDQGLFPKILDCMNRNNPLTIFGYNHPTRDGTCLRDYLDVRDLVNAILRLVDSFIVGPRPAHIIYNLGTGLGHTVLEIVKNFESVYNKVIPISFEEKNEADPSAISANFDRFRTEFDWTPQQSILDSIRSLM